jgi:hypothetical protein
LLLAACSGGGGSDGGAAASPPVSPPPPVENNDPPPTPPQTPVSHLRFVDATLSSGLAFSHRFERGTNAARVAAGVAVGDVNGDGWLDIYLAQGDTGTNVLFENRSQGGGYTFVDVTDTAGVAGSPSDKASGPAFADYDGDGDLDLFVGSVEYSTLRVFNNAGDGTFTEITAAAGLGNVARENNVGFAFGDYDGDDDLDLFIAHWTFTRDELPAGTTLHLWRNNGDGTFADVSDESLITGIIIESEFDYTFAPTFADIDSDGDLDLLVAADAGTSQVLVNQGDLGGGLYTFAYATDRDVINDQNGMGSSVADFDNDGDLDWFVTAISLGDEPDGRATPEDNAGFDLGGNRYYRNDGSGVFTDQTDAAGVRKGYWGWASCAADFNNDGFLDIFHVNGMDEPGTNAYLDDPSRLFINNGDGTFTEYAEPLGLIDTRSGRGVTCFDGDQDGDIDIVVSNNNDTARLFENDGGNQLNYVNVELQGASPNTQAVGARIVLNVGGDTQMREVHNGNNFVSQNPAEQHFGLADRLRVDTLRIVWPDGAETSRENVSVNQRVTVTYPDTWSTD